MGRASETLSKVQWSQELSGFVKLPKMSYGPTANAGLQVEENTIFWPILTICRKFTLTYLRFTGLNYAEAYQKRQIIGMI